MADSKKYDGSQWEHSLRKLATATEAVENPLYSDGTAITAYTLKGNTVQSGTPTPSSPITIDGVGNKTANLFNTFDIIGQVPSTGNGALVSYNGSTTSFIPISSGNVVVTKPEGILIYLMLYAANGDYIGYGIANAGTTINGSNISGYENAKLARLRIDRTSGLDDIQIMFNSGSTAKPYEPYGYKIPISNGQQTTNIYLGSTQTTRQIKKLVLTGDESFIVRGGEPSNVFFYGMSNTNLINNQAICSHYINQDSGSFNDLEDKHCLVTLSSDGTRSFIGIRDSDFPQTNEGTQQLRSWLSAQYANGTPVTIYYVLATPETATVNEPLMKIGNYADTLSNATSIPTTDGANTISVDTTVQPSEFTATWTGWHNASVKEWNGSQWNE